MSEEQDDVQKAKQLPEPCTYHLLCRLVEAAETYESGLIKADKTRQFDELLSPVMMC